MGQEGTGLRNVRRAATGGIIAVCAVALRAQVPVAPSFDVASVKRNLSGDVRVELNILPGGRFRATNVPVRELILLAYGLTDLQLAGAPGWIDDERVDIEARANAELSPGKPPAELRALLSERFNLKTHVERRELPVYLLVAAKSDGQLGPGVHRPAMDYCAEAAARSRAPRTPDASAIAPVPCLFRMYGGVLAARSMGFGVLASRLTAEVHRFVFDKTGLEGVYDYDMTYSPEAAVANPDPASPSLFTALQEQLGLKLESGRAPIEVTVVDRVEHLIPN